MDVTIVGSGDMARAIATRALAGGHQVTLVGTHLSKADELRGEGPVATAETVGGDLVVLAVPYTQAPHVVRRHADTLGGKVVVGTVFASALAVLP
jgi:predicted dinucleotide-binding enzyme